MIQNCCFVSFNPETVDKESTFEIWARIKIIWKRSRIFIFPGSHLLKYPESKIQIKWLVIRSNQEYAKEYLWLHNKQSFLNLNWTLYRWSDVRIFYDVRLQIAGSHSVSHGHRLQTKLVFLFSLWQFHDELPSPAQPDLI